MIHALHGFLGQPSDWDILPFEHRAPDLFRAVNAGIDETARRLLGTFDPGDAVIGYSMGGRVALHALLADAATAIPKIERAVIVSAGLGIADDSGRASRLKRDEEWARRFEADQWSAVMRDWNAQPVFGGHEVARDEGHFDRHSLANAVRNWSPASHEFLLPVLGGIRAHVLWVVGAEDAAYVRIARDAVAAIPRAELAIVDGAGHRVAWQRTAEFVSIVGRFLGVDACLP